MLKLILSVINGIRTRKTSQKSEPLMELEGLEIHTKSRPLGFDQRKMIRQLRLHEGERLIVYKCTAGKLTIGIGRNLEDLGISQDESAMMLANDIERVCKELNISLEWYRGLNDVRQRVIIDMAFNLGINGLLCFKNTLAHIQAERYEEASRSMLDSLWAKQVGQRAKRLANMMKTGKDPKELWFKGS